MSRQVHESDSKRVSENDCKVVPEFGEHYGETEKANALWAKDCSPGEQEPVENRVACLVNASRRRFETVFDVLGEGVVFQNRHGQIVISNDAAAEILGLTLDQLEGRSSVDPTWQALKEDGSPFPGDQHPAMVTLRTGVRQSNVLMNVLKPNGTRTWIKINSIPIFEGTDTEPSSVVCSFCDVTAIKESEQRLNSELVALRQLHSQIEARRRGLEKANQELREAADIDHLTKLKNRRGFFERLSSDVAQASRSGVPLSMLILEIDSFKAMNDELGTEAGNEILVLVGQAMKNTCRLSDFLARYREEKFVMILPHTTLPQALNLAQRLVGIVSGIECNTQLSACIGVVQYSVGSLSNEYVEQTEEALFRAKATGVGTCYCDAI